MKAKDIKNRKVSVYKNISSYLCDVTIEEVLTKCNELVKEKVTYLRTNFEYHSDWYKTFKKNNMSAWITGGTVRKGSTHRDDDIVEPSSILCIDIDACDNSDNLTELKEKIFELKFVLAVGLSVSGKGLFIIVPIADYTRTADYYSTVTKLITNRFNVVCDSQCKNIARLRFISYDDNMLIKGDDEDVIIWDQLPSRAQIMKSSIHCDKPSVYDKSYNISRTFKAMEDIINSGYCIDSYGAWYHIGCELKNHPDGYNLFCKLSHNNPKYNDSQDAIDKKWKNCVATGIDDNLHKKWQGMLKNKM